MQGTASSQKMKREVKQVYEMLIKFGYPALMSKNLLTADKEIGEFMSEYFQPTPKRENLIEWLILQNYPLYQQEIQKGEKKANKKKKLLSYLWKLGVMPFSKHTKNLDYEKYLQGLIGLENAINLVHNLCILLFDLKKQAKSKEDTQFGSFLEDLYKNYDSLINLEYDPYKISFPAAYAGLSEEEFDEKYDQLLKRMHLKQQGRDQEQQSNESFKTIFKEFQQNKEQFIKTYSLMTDKMKKTIDSNHNMLQTWKKQENNQLKNRKIDISPTLPKLYRQYKEKMKNLSLPLSELTASKQQIVQMITTLNEKVLLEP